MANIVFFFRLIRPINLLIVGLVMYLFRYIIASKGVAHSLTHLDFFLFVLTAVLVTATGYIINNIIDIPIDRINKKQKLVINTPRKKAIAYWSFYILIFVGILSTVYLAQKYNHYDYALLYPFSVIILWLYSKVLKRTLLLGNIVVAIFSASVALLVYLSEVSDIDNASFSSNVSYIFIMYTVFAFLTTLAREIVKDIEDMVGDRSNSCKTLPIVTSVKISKWVVVFINSLTIILVSYFIYVYSEISLNGIFVGIFGLIIPMVIINFIIFQTKSMEVISRHFKALMIMGILFLLFL